MLRTDGCSDSSAALDMDRAKEYGWARNEAGEAITNVPHRVVSHSPGGFEFGYGGSGPADLALNILQDFLLSIGHRGPTTSCYRGSCFTHAWLMHQQFKWDFVAKSGKDGGRVSVEEVASWVEQHQPELCTPDRVNMAADKWRPDR